MEIEADEPTADFLRRVEDKRCRYGISREEARRHFVPKLREDDKRRLDELSDVAAMLGHKPGDGCTLSWDQLIRLADHRTTTAPLSGARSGGWAVQGFGRPEVATPTPGTVAACPKPAMVDSGCLTKSCKPCSSEVGEACMVVSQPCELCILCNRANQAQRHTLATCWANPLNPGHKPQDARLRILELRHGGTPLHPCQTELAKQIPPDTPLPPGGRAVRPRGQPKSAAGAPPTYTVKAGELQAFQEDVAARLMAPGADAALAIKHTLEETLGVVVEDEDAPVAPAPGEHVDPGPRVYFARDGGQVWGDLQAAT